jgi:hypothetical protein
MRLKAGALLTAAAAALVIAAPASAELLKFTLNGDAVAVWFIDSNPTPSAVGPASFVLQDVPGNYSGFPNNGPTNYVADIEFYDSSYDGGFYIKNFYDNIDLLTTSGPQLFGGTLATPTFSRGTYALTDFDDPSKSYSLTISSGVPEPATWGLMILGFGAVGGAMRRRQSVKANVRFA